MEDQTKNRIREEWKVKFRKLWSSFNKDNEHLMSEKIEDLIDELLKSQRDSLVEKIEKLKKEDMIIEKFDDIINLIKNN